MSQTVEGFYRVRFDDHENPGQFINGGVVVLETQRVMGGDSCFFYRGIYEIKSDQFTGNVLVGQHTEMEGIGNAFGPNFKNGSVAAMAATRSGNTIVGALTIPNGNTLRFYLEKIAELP